MRLIAVDDEQLALDHLIEVAGGVLPGAEINGFTDVEEAVRYAEKEAPDLVFLDIEMREMDGLELAKRMKEINKSVNIVFVTGYSQYALDAFSIFASGYLLKPVREKDLRLALSNLRYPIVPKNDARLRVQTFGNFEVFVNGEILRFPRSKAKELFAYLVHKKGTTCTTREIAAVLFEDQAYTISRQKQMQTLISVMMRQLREAGVADCIKKAYNQLAVDVTKIDCDYYRFLQWDAAAINSYAGEYMANYAWAEFVIDYLNNKLL